MQKYMESMCNIFWSSIIGCVENEDWNKNLKLCCGKETARCKACNNDLSVKEFCDS